MLPDAETNMPNQTGLLLHVSSTLFRLSNYKHSQTPYTQSIMLKYSL